MKTLGSSSFRKALFLLCLTIVIIFAECSNAANRSRSRRQREKESGDGRYKKVRYTTFILNFLCSIESIVSVESIALLFVAPSIRIVTMNDSHQHFSLRDLYVGLFNH